MLFHRTISERLHMNVISQVPFGSGRTGYIKPQGHKIHEVPLAYYNGLFKEGA